MNLASEFVIALKRSYFHAKFFVSPFSSRTFFRFHFLSDVFMLEFLDVLSDLSCAYS